MGAFESKVIFSQKFPDARPVPMMKQTEENCTFAPSPGAERKSRAFISLAMMVCREFEIDTEITRSEHEINITMDLSCGWHDREVKRAFAAVLRLADDFTLLCNPGEPDRIRVSMSCRTHNLYSHGKKVEWR